LARHQLEVYLRATVTSLVLALDLDDDAVPSRLATESTIPLATGTFSGTA
jgi:hypothetical protein